MTFSFTHVDIIIQPVIELQPARQEFIPIPSPQCLQSPTKTISEYFRPTSIHMNPSKYLNLDVCLIDYQFIKKEIFFSRMTPWHFQYKLSVLRLSSIYVTVCTRVRLMLPFTVQHTITRKIRRARAHKCTYIGLRLRLETMFIPQLASF